MPRRSSLRGVGDPVGARLRAAAQPFGLIAALALVFMMLATAVSVFGRQLFGREIFGMVDLMELALTVCIFAALPGLFLRDENVTVDLVDGVLSPRRRRILRLVALGLGAAFLALSFSQMVAPLVEKLGSGETTMTLGIPRFWHWVPIVAGFALAVPAALAFAWHLARGSEPPPGDMPRAPGH